MIAIERYVVFRVTYYEGAGVFLRIDSAHDELSSALAVATRKTAQDFSADYVAVDLQPDAAPVNCE